jgi:hypothetical protein
MTEQPLDAQGEARDALSSVVADFGPRVLSDPRMLGSRMSDLLPDLPKERQLLITAAEADVAGDLTRHVQEQHLDANTAVQLVAGSLTDRKSIDPASSMWVASEYAKALGYPVQPGAMPPSGRSFSPPPPPPPLQPSGQDTVTTYGGHQGPTIGGPGGYGGGYGQQPAGGGGYQPQPPPAGGGYQPQPPQPPAGGGYFAQPPSGGQAPPTGAPPQVVPGWVPPTPPGKRNRGLIYGLGAGGAAVVIILAVGFGTNWFSGSKHVAAVTTPSTHPPATTPHPVTTASTVPTLPANIAPLTELLPSDMADVSTDCSPLKGPYNWSMPGLVTALSCRDPNLPQGSLLNAFQLDSRADFETAWHNFNTWWPFNISNAGPDCPPGSSGEGTFPFNDKYFPGTNGQVLECEVVHTANSGNLPGYAWAYPTDYTFIIAECPSSTPFSTLAYWWSHDSAPGAAPSPAS